MRKGNRGREELQVDRGDCRKAVEEGSWLVEFMGKLWDEKDGTGESCMRV